MDKQDINVHKVKWHELSCLEQLFTAEFGDEVNAALIHQRMRKIKQFYLVLRPLYQFSPWVRDLFNIFMIQVKTEFAGFIQLSYAGSNKLHLDFIAITKPFRGQGIGKYVLAGLLEEYVDPNNYGIVLEVRIENPAYRLYQRLGFQAKIQILHYERLFQQKEYTKYQLPGSIQMTELKNKERSIVYQLYQSSLPECLRGIYEKKVDEFTPSMFVHQLNWLKNKLMKNEEHEYVIKQKYKIIAAVNIKSYTSAQYHAITLFIHPVYELLRQRILEQIIAYLSALYQEGKVSINIYDNLIQKQHDLEKVGFQQNEAYFFMYRAAHSSEKNRKRSNFIKID